MGFVSMFFVLIVMYALIIGLIGIIGLIILITSIIRRKKRIQEGKKTGKIGIIIGSIFVAIPIINVLVIVGKFIAFIISIIFGG